MNCVLSAKPKKEKVSRAVRQLFGGQLWELDLLFAIEALDPILAYSPPKGTSFFIHWARAYDIRLLFYIEARSWAISCFNLQRLQVNPTVYLSH